MIRSYFKIALRILRKSPLFSFVNIFGLALCLSVCLLMITMIIDQNSFDRFHPNAENTYRLITSAIRKDGSTESYASTPFLLADGVRAQSPDVSNVVRLHTALCGTLKSGDLELSVKGFLTEPTFFDIFGFSLKNGDARSVLSDPGSLVISEETARRMFGMSDPIGRVVTIGDLGNFTITGIVRSSTERSHITFDVLGSVQLLAALEKVAGQKESMTGWQNYYSTYTYLTLNEGVDPKSLDPILSDLATNYQGGLLESRDNGYAFEWQRLDDITPGPHYSMSLGKGVPVSLLIFLSVLAVLGLIAAAFNYTNLVLARYMTRLREVGIRKVSGASRRQLIVQFVGESTIIALLAFLLAEVLLRFFLIPGFSSLRFTAEFDIRFDPTVIMYIIFVLFTLVIGMAAGLFPALVLSSFQPAAALKSASGIRVFSKLTLRKGIVVIQFALTIFLLIILNTIYGQIQYATRMEYFGFDWHRVVNIDLSGPHSQTIAEEMARFPDVAGYSFASHPLGTWADSKFDVRGTIDQDPVGFRDYSIDENFLDILRIPLAAGRGFRKSTIATDEIIVNEQLVQHLQLGTNDEAVGKVIYSGGKTALHIVGIVKDFVYKPVTYELEPLIFRYDPQAWNVLHVSLRHGDYESSIAYFKRVWKKFDPINPLPYRVYEYELSDVYAEVRDIQNIIGFLSLIILIVSTLGLLGMASYSMETRTKEVGVRLIMGATRWHMIRLLSGQYIFLVVTAAAVAVPLGLFVSMKLLEMFAYRMDFGANLALPGLILIFGMVLLTVGWQATRTLSRNPVQSLRCE